MVEKSKGTWQRSIVIIKKNWRREDKDKRRQTKKNDQTPIFSKLPFLDNYNKKTSTFNFLVHGHSSWSTTGLRLVRGPKALSIDFLRNQIMNVRRSKQTIETNTIIYDMTSWFVA